MFMHTKQPVNRGEWVSVVKGENYILKILSVKKTTMILF